MSPKEFEEKIGKAREKAKAYLLSKYTISPLDLDDVLQEASLKAMKSLPSFRGKCAFETWFIAICRNEIMAFFRRQKKHKNVISREDLPANKDFSSPEPDTSISEEQLALIYETMAKLSEKHQQVIKIALGDPRSSKEIANLLHIPVNSARTRLHYAKKRLKKLIESYAHKSDSQHSRH
jgi:RNA polymerase sigma-70 factor (ECF subfamily)